MRFSLDPSIVKFQIIFRIRFGKVSRFPCSFFAFCSKPRCVRDVTLLQLFQSGRDSSFPNLEILLHGPFYFSGFFLVLIDHSSGIFELWSVWIAAVWSLLPVDNFPIFSAAYILISVIFLLLVILSNVVIFLIVFSALIIFYCANSWRDKYYNHIIQYRFPSITLIRWISKSKNFHTNWIFKHRK